MEIYKDLSNQASKEFEKLLNSQLSKVKLKKVKLLRVKLIKSQKNLFPFHGGIKI